MVSKTRVSQQPNFKDCSKFNKKIHLKTKWRRNWNSYTASISIDFRWACNFIPILVALYFCGDQSCLLAAITSLNSPNQNFLYRVYHQKSIPVAKIPVMYFTVTFSFWESMPGSLINLSITFKTNQATHNLSQNGFPPIYKELISKDSAMKK